jgi:hypothetical protein
MFIDHTQRRSTVGSTPLDEWSARRTDLYLTTHDTHNRQISLLPVGFEPTISVGERPVASFGDWKGDGENVYNRDWDVAAGFLVTTRTLIWRLQGTVVDQREGCRHVWYQQLQFQSAENLKNLVSQVEESLNRTCRIDSRESKLHSSNFNP